LLWKAARATTEADFKQHLEAMKIINPKCHDWLLSTADPAHWADLYFKGRRYGHLTSNIAEAFNAKILVAREMPILAMLEEIRHQLMDWFAQRRGLEDSTSGQIVSRVAKEIQTLHSERARRYRCQVSDRDNTLYEVKSKQTLCEYIVNLAAETCSCRDWQFKVGVPRTITLIEGISMWSYYCCNHDSKRRLCKLCEAFFHHRLSQADLRRSYYSSS